MLGFVEFKEHMAMVRETKLTMKEIKDLIKQWKTK